MSGRWLGAQQSRIVPAGRTPQLSGTPDLEQSPSPGTHDTTAIICSGKAVRRTMRRLGAEQPILHVVADQRGCPTAAGDLAGAIIAVCGAIRSGKPTFGTYHLTNAGATSRHEFAGAIFEDLAARGERVPDQVSPSPPPNFRPRRHGRRILSSIATASHKRLV